jgi:hypothetical protein
VIVDDFSRFTWVFFLNEKSEVFNIFKSLIKRGENESELKIKKARSDNGSEFKNTRINDFCDDRVGIELEFLNKYTP